MPTAHRQVTHNIVNVIFVGYRVTKYCGEHLVLVNELPEPDPVPVHQSTKLRRSIESKDEKDASESENVFSDLEGPVAEALIQNDQMFHNLKILKSSPSEIQGNGRSVPGEDTKSAKLNKGVFYSQV